MKHCLLAIHKQDQYFSVPHYYRDPAQLCGELNQKYCSSDAAEATINSGNISFFDGTSFSRLQLNENNVNTAVHNTPLSLVEYALSVNATHIICFEGAYWLEIPIAEIELENIAETCVAS